MVFSFRIEEVHHSFKHLTLVTIKISIEGTSVVILFKHFAGRKVLYKTSRQHWKTYFSVIIIAANLLKFSKRYNHIFDLKTLIKENSLSIHSNVFSLMYQC